MLCVYLSGSLQQSKDSTLPAGRLRRPYSGRVALFEHAAVMLQMGQESWNTGRPQDRPHHCRLTHQLLCASSAEADWRVSLQQHSGFVRKRCDFGAFEVVPSH